MKFWHWLNRLRAVVATFCLCYGMLCLFAAPRTSEAATITYEPGAVDSLAPFQAEPVAEPGWVDELYIPTPTDPDMDERRVVVMTPEDMVRGGVYSLVLYFHGYGLDNSVAFEDGVPGIPDLESPDTSNYVKIVYEAMASLRASEATYKDWIVVMIDGSNCLNGTFYINSNFNGNLGDWATQEVPAWLEEYYGIQFKDDPEARALVGHSMGGYGALRLSQIYHPGSDYRFTYGIAAANNPPVSFLASSGVAVHAAAQACTAGGECDFSYSGEPSRWQVLTENGEYIWPVMSAVDTLWAMSATMDPDSGLKAPETGHTDCDPEGGQIDYVLKPNGLISMVDFVQWLGNDIVTQAIESPEIWKNSHVYVDGQARQFKDEYYLQYNASYFDRTMSRLNTKMAGDSQDGPFLDYVTDFYPNSDDSEHYTAAAPLDKYMHFYQLSYRTKKALSFVGEKMKEARAR